MRRLLASLCVALLAACGSPQTGDAGPTPLDIVAGWSGSPTMNPGIPCLSCHATDPGYLASYRPWSIGGTVFGSPDALADAGQPNVEVLVTDANGKQLTLVSNAAGNFYTEEPLVFPLQSLMVQNQSHRMQMDLLSSSISSFNTGPGPLTIADCNSCHYQGSFTSAPGRLFVKP